MNIDNIKNRLFRFTRPIVSFYTNQRRSRKMKELVVERTPDLFKENLSGKIVFDLGANRGDFSKLFVSKHAQVWAFEPNSYAFHQLYKNLHKFKNINLLNCAVSDKTSIINLFNHKNSFLDPIGFSISSSIKENKINMDLSNPEKTLVLNFSDLLKNFEQIYILKIDIEGAEIDIWNSIREHYRKIKYVFIEIHDQINPGLRVEIDDFILKHQLSKCWFTNWV